MADKINYVTEAFKRQENLIALAGFTAAGTMFDSGFFLLAGALEVAYLWLVGTNPRFHRVVDAEKNKARQIYDENEKTMLVSSLPEADRERYQALLDVRRRVYDAWESRDAVTKSLLQPSIEKMEYLLDTFLRTQLTLKRMREHLTMSDRAYLEKQVTMLEADLKRNIPDKVKEVKSKNLEILKQRVARLQKLAEDMDVVKTQLDTLENAIKFVSDQSASLTDPRAISDQIDHAVAEVGETEKSIQDVEVFLGAQEEMNKKQEAAAERRVEEHGS